MKAISTTGYRHQSSCGVLDILGSFDEWAAGIMKSSWLFGQGYYQLFVLWQFGSMVGQLCRDSLRVALQMSRITFPSWGAQLCMHFATVNWAALLRSQCPFSNCSFFENAVCRCHSTWVPIRCLGSMQPYRARSSSTFMLVHIVP